MISKLKKASQISEATINPLYIDDELIQIEVISGDNKYLVSCLDDLFRCNCPDFSNRGINKEEGSFLCKHCLAVINYLIASHCNDKCTDCNKCLDSLGELS